jgi:hypothetical protein
MGLSGEDDPLRKAAAFRFAEALRLAADYMASASKSGADAGTNKRVLDLARISADELMRNYPPGTSRKSVILPHIQKLAKNNKFPEDLARDLV